MLLTLQPAFVRANLSGAAAVIGSIMPARSVTNSVTGGMFTAPVRMPATMDPSKPTDVRTLISPAASQAIAGQNLKLRLSSTIARGPSNQLNAQLDALVPIPNPWNTGEQIDYLFDDGSGHTFPPGAILPNDWVSFLVQRLGPDAQDTYGQTILIAETLPFSYTDAP